MSARTRLAALALVAVVLLVAAAFTRVRPPTARGTTPLAAIASAPRASTPQRSAVAPSAPATRLAVPSAASRDPREDLLQRRLARASETRKIYLESTRYPPESRPLRERPDLARAHAVATHLLPIAKGGGDARVELAQDRYFVASGEKVTLTARCFLGGLPARCEALRGELDAPDQPRTSIEFSEEGGVQTAVVDPAALGLGAVRGAVAVLVSLRVGATPGTARYDFELTPTAPAVFAGFAGEALEDGSLVVRLRVRVLDPGRYVVRARFADASGQRFALATFNGVLGAGEAEVPLRLFGKLARDEAAASPYRVLDLEGFRLLEDVTPDREAIASVDGEAYTTRRYALSDFSDDAWTSPEKSRHVAALDRALDRAGED